MKLLAVSDRVVDHLYDARIRKHYPEVDLLIGCGDVPYYYLDFLVSALNVPLVYVRGNHDQGPQYTADGRTLTDVPGGTNIHGRVLSVKGLLLAGLEGSMRYRPEAQLMYSEAEMRREVGRLILRLYWHRLRFGRFIDILVTHSPPYGIHDRADVAHTGFKVLRSFLEWFKPRYLLHGHIHVYRQDEPRITQYEQTTVINVYPYHLLEMNHVAR